MNEKYYLARSEKQIENINEDLELLRLERDSINERIANLMCVRDLLKHGLKKQ